MYKVSVNVGTKEGAEHLKNNMLEMDFHLDGKIEIEKILPIPIGKTMDAGKGLIFGYCCVRKSKEENKFLKMVQGRTYNWIEDKGTMTGGATIYPTKYKMQRRIDQFELKDCVIKYMVKNYRTKKIELFDEKPE